MKDGIRESYCQHGDGCKFVNHGDRKEEKKKKI